MAKEIAKRFLVSGRVQGVFYRAFAVDNAIDLDIKGTVRNLSDGRVEIFAQGNPGNVVEFKVMLEEGPPAAIVTSVDEFEEKPREDVAKFIIKY